MLARLAPFSSLIRHPATRSNGANVVDANGVKVAAVGHVDPSGGGARNAFGNQFWAEWVNKFGWNHTFCCMDADKDGQTNGLELGDPCCVWSVNATPAYATDISHPGDAASMTKRAAPACAATACPAAQ